MEYTKKTNRVVASLNQAATRGFLSNPVPSKYGIGMSQAVVFTEEEKKLVREYVAEFHSVLSQIDYPTFSMFDDNEPKRTASLLSMVTYMLHDEKPNPEYVSSNAKRLHDALESHSNFFDALELGYVEGGESK